MFDLVIFLNSIIVKPSLSTLVQTALRVCTEFSSTSNERNLSDKNRGKVKLPYNFIHVF